MAEPLPKSGDQQETKAPANPLLDSLVYVTGFFGHARSAESLVVGLAAEKGNMTPKIFCQAAERAGFRARVMKRALSDIPSEVLPAIALLKSRAAVVILRRGDKGQLQVMDPSTRTERSVSQKDFAKDYAGYALYIRPDYEEREGGSVPLARHWLWSNVVENAGVYVRVLVASFLINCFALTSPLFIMNFYNRVLPNDAVETGWVLATGAAIVFLFDFIIRTLRSYFIDLAGRR